MKNLLSYLTIFISFLFITVHTHSQLNTIKITPVFTPNYSFVLYKPESVISIKFKRIEFKYGIIFYYPITKKININSGVLESSKAIEEVYVGKPDPTYYYDGIYKQTGIWRYTEVPLIIDYKLFNYNHLQFYFSAGTIFDFHTGTTNYKIIFVNDPTKKLFWPETNNFGSFNFRIINLSLGLPVIYNFSDKFGIVASPSVIYNLIDKKVSSKILTVECQIGFLF
ncbi:MAG: hypothetical protein HY738_21735 [Bacteroidia bacterium]|nr:hypothetical protein [Bacteroidia bacterium]